MIEEYFRFVVDNETVSIGLKKNRHQLADVEHLLQPERLLSARNTMDDCFADQNRPEELQRNGIQTLLAANFKRGQEAARVIEEYAKLTDAPEVSEKAKTIRFSLYTLEQEQIIGHNHGKE